jgi:hypothetical protein
MEGWAADYLRFPISIGEAKERKPNKSPLLRPFCRKPEVIKLSSYKKLGL